MIIKLRPIKQVQNEETGDDGEVFLMFLLNPIFAMVFCLNLIGMVKRLHQGEEKVTKNAFWLTFSGIFIVTTITWMPMYMY